MIAVGVIMPVLPALVGSFSDSKADNAFWYGVVACSFGAANFIGAPILGALSDRFGRRPVLLTTFSGMGKGDSHQIWVTWRCSGTVLGNIAVPGPTARPHSCPEAASIWCPRGRRLG